ncbi:MAG: cyclase family protein [Pirellulaceae bacterium]
MSKSFRCLELLLMLAMAASAGCGATEDPSPSITPGGGGGDGGGVVADDGFSGGAPPNASAASFPGGKIIDLTHAFDEQTIYWPTAEGFKLTVDSAGVTDQGFYYAANSFSAAEHGGTHIDAPIHFFANRKTVDAVPLERLIGPAVLIDVSAKCEADPDYQIGVDDLYQWEQRHDRQLVDVIVLLRTGYDRLWPDAEAYLGTREKGPAAVAKLHFPGLAPEAAKWLVEQRQVRAVGIDTASIDYGQSERFESHVTLFSSNVPAFENVANLEGLPAVGFSVIALPMKIAGGSGGPLRIVAVVP